MDGTLEQPAHTNDQTVTGHTENSLPVFSVSLCIMLLLFRRLCLKNSACVPRLEYLQSLSMTGDRT